MVAKLSVRTDWEVAGGARAIFVRENSEAVCWGVARNGVDISFR